VGVWALAAPGLVASKAKSASAPYSGREGYHCIDRIVRFLAQALKQLSHGTAREWVDRLWRDLREWDEDEGAVGKAGMGDFEVGLGYDLIAEEQDIQVECARAVWKTGCAVAAKFALDCQQAVEQGAGGEIAFESDDGVDEVGLVGKADGLGGVERRTGDEAAEGFEPRCGGS